MAVGFCNRGVLDGPEICREIFGRIAKNAAAMSGDPCLEIVHGQGDVGTGCLRRTHVGDRAIRRGDILDT